jgi:ribosomal protein L7Ae-like RNA K-turn-binding protein
LQQSPSVLPRWHKAAAVVAAEAAEREVVAPVAPAAERLEVPVALVERQAQLAEQQRAPPIRERRLVAA